ncbi:MAG: phosphate ABC transporter substrate-binding protein, partial [Anaerolineaceae bacterium]|nr:phosphate ABC transporter substrate-binding protein [Anaerolineaceae bacterium]
MSKKSFLITAALAIGAITLTSCASTAPLEKVASPTEATALSGHLQLAGSTTVQPLAEILAETFMDMNESVSIDVQGGGSSVGITSAGEGTADIGTVSRDIKDSEFEIFPNLKVFTIAYDGIAIVVHPDVKIPNLTIEETRAIFSGSITNFSEVGGIDAPIIIVSREEGSGTRAAFEDLVMKYKNKAGEKQEDTIAESALLQQSNGQVRTIIAETPNSIGYLSFGFLDDSVRSVPIDNIVPCRDAVLDGSYP